MGLGSGLGLGLRTRREEEDMVCVVGGPEYLHQRRQFGHIGVEESRLELGLVIGLFRLDHSVLAIPARHKHRGGSQFGAK